MSNTTVFVAQIVSVLTYVGIALGLYGLLVKQKDATIEFLQKQLDAAKDTSPDNLLKQLNGRIKILEEELNRLSKDKNTSDELLARKDKQLKNLRIAAQTTVDELNRISASLQQVELNRKARSDALQKLLKERSQKPLE